MADETGSQKKKCSSCSSDLKYIGKASLRYGGTGGGTNFMFGDIAELGESTWPLDFYQCTQCGHIEIFDKKSWPEVKET